MVVGAVPTLSASRYECNYEVVSSQKCDKSRLLCNGIKAIHLTIEATLCSGCVGATMLNMLQVA